MTGGLPVAPGRSGMLAGRRRSGARGVHRRVWQMGACAGVVMALGQAACSHLDHHWRQPDYVASGPTAVKRVVVRGLADSSWAPGLAPTLSLMATDYAKLRRNFIVMETPAEGDSCQGRVEGVLSLEALSAQRRGDKLALTLRGELRACRGQRLLWQAQGHREMSAQDPRLAELTASYRGALGEAAVPWAASVFVLGQEVLDAVPNPQLTDEEVEEKIEAG